MWVFLCFSSISGSVNTAPHFSHLYCWGACDSFFVFIFGVARFLFVFGVAALRLMVFFVLVAILLVVVFFFFVGTNLVSRIMRQAG